MACNLDYDAREKYEGRCWKNARQWFYDEKVSTSVIPLLLVYPTYQKLIKLMAKRRACDT